MTEINLTNKMGVAFLAQIQLNDYTAPAQGLSPKSLSYIGQTFVQVTQEIVDDAFLYLQQTFGLFDSSFDVTGIQQTDDIVSLLDSGAARVFVTSSQSEDLKKTANLDQSRIITQFDDPTNVKTTAGATDSLYFSAVKDVKSLSNVLGKADNHPAVYVKLESPTIETAQEVIKLGAVPIIPATCLTMDTKAEPSLIPASTLLLANVESDRPDGLFSTLVTDERGIALGLVYSSHESVYESLRTGDGVYQSRKRGLWYKGATSGDTQELVRVTTDCDQDCLLFVVRQKGRGEDFSVNLRYQNN
jgi:phosphoribosyl-ATP pyrophosphohydrolase / phosphoribosyl-AMP cyclohydrolase / histidinol dehydrogenase